MQYIKLVIIAPQPDEIVRLSGLRVSPCKQYTCSLSTAQALENLETQDDVFEVSARTIDC